MRKLLTVTVSVPEVLNLEPFRSLGEPMCMYVSYVYACVYVCGYMILYVHTAIKKLAIAVPVP